MKEGDSRQGKKNIWLLGSSSFFNDAGSEIITPILPFYILALGGGGVAIGLLGGLRDGLSSILKFFGGWFSDRAGKRKGLIFVGYFISVLLKFLLGLAGSWKEIITLSSLERAGKLRDAPRDALITLSTKKHGHGFGIHQMLDNAGGVIGTVLAIILLAYLQLSFKAIMFIAAGISAISLVPLFFVKDKSSKTAKRNFIKDLSTLNKPLLYAISVTCVFALANFALYLFMILRVKEVTGSTATALVLYALFSLSGALLVVPLSSLSDKVGRKIVLMVAYTLFVIVAFGFALLSGIQFLAILFLLYGVSYAVTESSQRALISDFAGEMKGTAMGAYHGLRGIVSIAAGLIAGIIWNISHEYMFYYLAFIGIIAMFFLYILKEK